MTNPEMTDPETEIDPYPVRELTTRFGVGRTALYSSMKALNVEPTGKVVGLLYRESNSTD